MSEFLDSWLSLASTDEGAECVFRIGGGSSGACGA